MWQAYGILNMTDVNRYIVDSFNDLRSSFRLAGGSLNEINYCSVVGFDGGYEFYPGLIIGGRIGQMRTSQGHLTGTITSNPVTGQVGPASITFNSALVPYMVGGQLRLAEGQRFSFLGAVYLGYATASAKFDYSDSRGAFGITTDVPLEGSGVCDDFSGELRYKFTDYVSLGASIHLMNARITTMNVTKDIPEADLFNGSSFRDRRNSVLVFDYSNVAASLGLYFAF